MEEMIDNTLAEVRADEFSIFLSGERNFRYEVYPEYKANRTAPKPRHLKDLKDYLIQRYNAVVADGCEADDLLGIAQTDDTIICSIDKDLRQVPGNHYSFEISGKSSLGKIWVRPAEKVYVSPIEGIRHFYYQTIVGDATDNLKGVVGAGKVTATNLLKDLTTEAEMLDAVRNMYSSDEEFLMNADCLWIFRAPNDRYSHREFIREHMNETGFS